MIVVLEHTVAKGQRKLVLDLIDRIIHHSHIFMLGGESYRLKQKTLS